ncbi:MAG TPA: ATP-binding cassette domain-containing protein [Vicinamibacterales bacterium]
MPPATPSVEVEFRNVSYHALGPDAQRLVILRSLNLSLHRGETLILLGRSGSGKTTALKLVNRLLVPSDGQVLVENRSTLDWDPIQLRRRTGYVMQESGLLPHFTVEQNTALVPRLEGWSPDRMTTRVEELLRLVGLEPASFRRRFPRELSGGQRQRVGVARALAADPPLLLMDEPFGALDPITRAALQREFLALQEQLHKTVIFVTHDLREALLLGTRIALLDSGGLTGVFSPDEFLRTTNPEAAAYVAAFRLNDPAAPGDRPDRSIHGLSRVSAE